MIERETEQEGDDTHMGSMQLLNALKAKQAKKQPQSKGLMYVEAKVNGMSTKAMIDTGATHNFVSEEVARRLKLREQVARIEAEVGTQVSRLDVEIDTATEANSTLSTQVADAVLRLDSQRESMEAREKAAEERIGSFHDRMQVMTEEFEERIRSLEGGIVLLKRVVGQGTPSAADPPPAKV